MEETYLILKTKCKIFIEKYIITNIIFVSTQLLFAVILSFIKQEMYIVFIWFVRRITLYFNFSMERLYYCNSSYVRFAVNFSYNENREIKCDSLSVS